MKPRFDSAIGRDRSGLFAAIHRLTGVVCLCALTGAAAGATYFMLERGFPARAQSAGTNGYPNGMRENLIADRAGVLLRHSPVSGERNRAPLTLSIDYGANPNTETINTIYRFGANMLPNGYPENGELPAQGIEWETAWENGRTGKLTSEFHVASRDTDGTLARPITYSFENGNMKETLNIAFESNVFGINRVNGANFFKVDSNTGRMYLTGGLDWTIEHGTNNSWFLAQAGGKGSGIVQVLKVDKRNRVVIGGAQSRGVITGGDMSIGGNHAILPRAGQRPISIGSDRKRSGLNIHGNGSDVLVLEDGKRNRWSIRPAGAFQIHDLDNGRTVMQFEKDAPDNLLVGRKSGNVGIGTNAPESRLHVAGALSVEAVLNPRNPGEDKAVLYLDQASGRLMARINSGGEVKNYILAGD